MAVTDASFNSRNALSATAAVKATVLPGSTLSDEVRISTWSGTSSTTQRSS